MSIKQKVFSAFYGSHINKASLTLQLVISVLIILNVIAVVLETVPQIHGMYGSWFHYFELFSVSIFGVEYLARVWVSDLSPHYQHPVRGRLRYIMSPMSLVDIIAIMPYFLSMAGVDLLVLRILRLLRLLKFTRYSKAMSSLTTAIKSGKDELYLSLIVMAILLLISATLIYFAEHDAQPDVFSSIPASLWWSVITLSTIGYGDIYPITVAGKIIAGISAILGIAMIALPGGIVASNLITNARENKKHPANCPHCGK